MEPMQNNEGRTPFADLTNTINGARHTTSNSQAQVDECAQRRREREKARHATMTHEERDEKNKKHREKYHLRKLELNQPRKTMMAMKIVIGYIETTHTNLCRLIKITHVPFYFIFVHNTNCFFLCLYDAEANVNIMLLYIYVDDYSDRCIDLSGIIDLTDASPYLNPASSIDNIVTCPKEHKRELDRDRRAAMSPEQKVLINKRRHDLYAAKNAVRKLQMTPQEKEMKRKESKNNYNRTVREHRANNMHPDPLVVDGTSSMPPNDAQAHTPDSMVEHDYYEDAIFEEYEEENETYFFAEQEDDEERTDVEHNLDMDEQENSESDVPDPYDRVYADVPSESHMLPSMLNCEHCNAKKFEGEPPGFCCRGGKIHLSTLETPPKLMRLWSSSDADARHFCANIRYFNGHFSFTSLYCHQDRMTTNMRIYGVYMFRAHG